MTGRSSSLQRTCRMLIAAVASLAGCGDEPRHAALPATSTIVALGDSLTYGTGASDGTSYPSVLATISGWKVVNAGIPGETAAEGCSRLPGLIEDHRPRLVLVLLGGNDLLRRSPERAVKDALASCVATARAEDTPLVLMPVPRFGAGGLANAALYADASRELNVPLVDAGLAELFGRASMRSDPIHLNAAGYRAMAAIVADGLRAEGFLSKK